MRIAFSFATTFAAMAPATAGLYTFSSVDFSGPPTHVSMHQVHPSGQVVLNSLHGGINAYILSSGGTLRQLSPVAGMQSQVLGVNALGTAVGVSSPTYGPPYFSRATVWKGNQATLLPGIGGLYEDAMAINDAGIIVGSSYSRVTPYSGITHALWWDADGGVHYLGTGGGLTAGAFGLNNRGAIVGLTRFLDGIENGTVWKDGIVTHVGTLGGRRSNLTDVNDQGWAVGDSLLAGEEELWHAVLWDGTSLRDLGTLGGRNSFAYEISEDGTVFGSATTAAEKHRATIWKDGRTVDLHDLITNAADLGNASLHTAMGMDRHGNIYGVMQDPKTYRMGAFVLTPLNEVEVPEPGTLPVLVAGLFGIASLSRTRRQRL